MERTCVLCVAAAIIAVPAGGVASSLAGFDTMVEVSPTLHPGVLLHYKKISNTAIRLAIDVPQADGWAGLAVGATMVGNADTVIGGALKTGGTASDIKAYIMTAMSPSGVSENIDQSWLSNTQVIHANSRTQVLFTRPFDNGFKAITWAGETSMLFAYGPGTTIQYHAARSPFTINLATPDSATPAPTPAPTAPSSVTPSGCPTSTLTIDGSTTYDCSFASTIGVTLHWRRNVAANTVDMALQGSAGWIALGFPSTAGAMVGATAVVGQGAGDVSVWSLAGQTVGSVTQSTSTAYTSSAVDVTSGTVTIRLGGVAVADEANANYIVAKGSGTFPVLHSERAAFNVNMITGAASATATKDPPKQGLVKLHGIMQTIAWGFLAPFAVVIKRFKPGMADKKAFGYPLAFVLHGIMMSTAVLLCIGGVGIAFAAFDKRSSYGHGPLGTVIVLLAFLQPWPAIFCRPDAEKSPGARRIFSYAHRGVGITLVILTIANCFTGTINYKELWDEGESTIYVIVLILGLVTTILIGAGLQARKGMAGSSKKGADDSGDGDVVGKPS